MALNMSDDEDILHPRGLRRVVGRQPFEHPDAEEEEDIMHLASDSDGEAEQVQTCTQSHEHCVFTRWVTYPHTAHTANTIQSQEHDCAGNKKYYAGR